MPLPPAKRRTPDSMPPLAWLAIALAGFVAAYLVGWPAWESYRSRETRDDNTERYLAWRGRADRTPSASSREGMTGVERRRVYLGAALAIAAALSLLTFFATS
jgi:hypothetical protein